MRRPIAPPSSLALLSAVLVALASVALAFVDTARADPSPTEELPSAPVPSTGELPAVPSEEEGPAPREDAPLEAPDQEGLEADSHEDRSHEDGAPARPRRTFRWSDGPRLVPAPRGASMERAEALGLGTRECASRLLHGAPDARWTAAARGRSPARLLWPIDEGRWVRGYGYVRTTRPDLIHRGVDISAPVGTVVRAAADGIVAYSDNGIRGYGNVVLIVHRNGWMTLYAHNARTTVQPGYRVRRGERIAIVGTTGITHGPHVHFELWQSGHAVDPGALFDGGPEYVERLGLRAARRGEVPPPREVSAADRPAEAPLTPHPNERHARGAAPGRASERTQVSARGRRR